tara:strand:+ start:4599 stop:5585 length:987 start_codon:yes stop_codon:yes gene_type:complete
MAWAPNVPGSSAGNLTHSLAAFLRVFSGETVAAYNQAVVIKDKLRSRNITSGKSATFPTISTSSAKLHTPGDDLFGDSYAPAITNDEQIIQINKLLIDTSFVDNLDEMMNHFDARSEYASQMGAALATAGDRWAIGALARGATGTTATTGSTAIATAGGTAGTALVKDAMQKLAVAMDVAAVPKGDRYCVLSPAAYYGMMLDNDTVSSDFGKGGDRSDPGQLSYLGLTIISSHVWDIDFVGEADLTGTGKVFHATTGADGRASYQVALDKTFGLGFHKEAAGVVSLHGMSTETSWIPERQGNLIVTKQAIGIDILRPASSFLLQTTAV